MALVFFPDGINPKTSHCLLTLLEMARTLLLDTIERYKVVPIQDNRLDPETKNAPAPEEAATEKKGVIGFLGGLFGRKKAG
jgi:molecular chaperone GrpE (heat shock protein)